MYDHRGLEGLRCLLRSTFRSPQYTPSAHDGAMSFLNWSCFFLRHMSTFPLLLPSYHRLRLCGICSKIPPPLFCSVFCAFAGLVVCFVFSSQTVFRFQLPGVNAFRKVHIFVASSLAAAVNTLDVCVFKRRRSLIATPRLHSVQRSAVFPYKTVQFELKKTSVPQEKQIFIKIVL